MSPPDAARRQVHWQGGAVGVSLLKGLRHASSLCRLSSRAPSASFPSRRRRRARCRSRAASCRARYCGAGCGTGCSTFLLRPLGSALYLSQWRDVDLRGPNGVHTVEHAMAPSITTQRKYFSCLASSRPSATCQPRRLPSFRSCCVRAWARTSRTSARCDFHREHKGALRTQCDGKYIGKVVPKREARAVGKGARTW